MVYWDSRLIVASASVFTLVLHSLSSKIGRNTGRCCLFRQSTGKQNWSFLFLAHKTFALLTALVIFWFIVLLPHFVCDYFGCKLSLEPSCSSSAINLNLSHLKIIYKETMERSQWNCILLSFLTGKWLGRIVVHVSWNNKLNFYSWRSWHDPPPTTD